MDLLKFTTGKVVFILLAIPLFLSSCSAPKNVTYFKNIPDSGLLKSVELAQFKEPVIKNDDILSVSIQTIDPVVTESLNQVPSQGSSSGLSAQGQSAPGYLVNKEGFIELPVLGKLKVSDLTTTEATEVIQQNASKFLKSPTVQVRFANYKITVLGEVNKPSAYIVPNEKVTIVDAIGLAGDLTIYGKRENVLVIRDENGKKEFARLNLTSSNIFSSPYYYLRPNDVVYVEPNKARIAANNLPRVQALTIVLSALSLLVVLLTRIN